MKYEEIYKMVKDAKCQYAVVFDTETTGLSKNDKILQLAWTQFGPDKTESKSIYFDWPGPVEKNPVEHINHINTSEIRKARESNGKYATGEVWDIKDFPLEWLQDWVSGRCLIIAHNILFDIRLIRQTLEKIIRFELNEKIDELITTITAFEKLAHLMENAGSLVVNHCRANGGRPTVEDVQKVAKPKIADSNIFHIKQFDTMLAFNQFVNLDAIINGDQAMTKINNLDATKYMLRTDWGLEDTHEFNAATNGLHDAANDIVVTTSLAQMLYRATGYTSNFEEQIILHKLKRML